MLLTTALAASAADDHGDTAATATALTSGVTVSGRIDPGDDVDYFSVVLAETAVVVFTTTGALDTVGVLYDSSERQIATNDDGGAGFNFRIRRELAAGTYYLRVRSYRLRTGDYEVSANVFDDLGLGTSIASYLDPGDTDYFRIEIGETTGVIFTATGEVDLIGRLYDADGGRLAYDDDRGDGRNFRIRIRLEPGTYFLEVSGYSNSSGPYEVWAITDEWEDAVCDEYGDRTAPFVPAAGWPDSLQGFVRLVNRRDRRQFFDFEAIDDAGTSYDLTVILDPYESLHFNSEDLQYGNAAKGRLVGTGAAPVNGHWRLCLSSSSVGQSAYIRTRDGFLTAMNRSVTRLYQYGECPFPGDDPARSNDCRYWKIPIFNPASNFNQASSLRIANNSGEAQQIWIVGYLGDGGRNRAGDPLFATGTIPARAAVEITARQLETGAGLPLDDASGRIGPASGKWDLEVWAGENADLVIANLMRTPTGHVTNLSDAVIQTATYRGVSAAEARIAELKAAVEVKERARIDADRERAYLLNRLED